MAERQALRAASLLRSVGARRAANAQASVRSSAAALQSGPKLSPQHLQRSQGFRAIHSGTNARIDILESSDKPQDVEERESGEQAKNAAPISDDEYHQRADRFFNELLEKLEEKSEETGDVDIDYAVR